MDIYLTVMVAVLVITQIVRITQNAVHLYRQNRLLNAQLSQVEDITQDDLNTQRKAYRLIVEHFEQKQEG